MADTDRSILIDKDLRPAYYDDFHCIMGACRFNCCDDGWDIHFSKRDYLKIRQAPKSPELEELTRKCLRRLREREHDGMYAEFHSGGARHCAYHSPEGLCRLQLECGEKTLPEVCRVFPRHKMYMPSGYLERSLSPSCEGVLALLWDLPDGIEFRSDPLPKEKYRKISVKEDNPLPLWFSVVREWCIDVLQDRRFTLPQRIFLMGMGLKELADGEEDIKRWMKRAAALPDSVGTSIRLPDGDQELVMHLLNCLHTLMKIRTNDPDREAVKMDLLNALKVKSDAVTGNATASFDGYRGALARYQEKFGNRDYFMENLMVAVFFHLHIPEVASREDLWKSYVNFCNLYGFYRFLSVMSCREGAAGDRNELFRLIVFGSRGLIHNSQRQNRLRDNYFKHDSATLAHMAILLCG